jgi:phosphoribosylanthranilate isomerase
MLSTVVKVSAVGHLSDARYCAGMGVEMIGFSMDTLTSNQLQEIRGWLAGVRIVGETAQTQVQEVQRLLDQYQPDMVQVGDARLALALAEAGQEVILALDLSSPTFQADWLSCRSAVSYFLLENSDEWTRLEGDTWKQIAQMAQQSDRVLLGFGIQESNVKEVLKEISLAGVALRGSDELRPGFTDFGDLMNILEVLEVED